MSLTLRPIHFVLALALVVVVQPASAAPPNDPAKIDAVTRIVVDGALLVEIETDDVAEVRVAPESVCAAAVVWSVRDQTLSLSTGATRCTGPAVVRLKVRDLGELVVRGPAEVALDGLRTRRLSVLAEGEGDVEIDDLECDELVVISSGSGDVKASGRADRQRHELRGEGDIAAAELVGADVDVISTGSGDVHVHATEVLGISATGSGEVRYSGRPVLRQRAGARRTPGL